MVTVSDITDGQAATPLLGTKLHAPRRRRGAIQRSRLTKHLTGRDLPALTLVSAPAGFGKTTLLTHWFSDDQSTAWLSLDSGDNDPAVFWSYVIGALRTVAPGTGETALSLLRSAPPPLEAVAGTLLN